jgi:alpha-ketoglutarate-dependent 2,4-dichlorophenoxyacetate dioxygenase
MAVLASSMRFLGHLRHGKRSMNLVVTPLHPLFVAKITNIDLGKPINENLKRGIERAMDQYAVCVFPGQNLEDEQQIAFSRLYGPLASPSVSIPRGARIRHKKIFDVSNLDENGGILGEKDARSILRLVTQLWHTDLSFRQESATWSVLHARVIPPSGGDTEFADTRAAYDALPDAMKSRLESLAAEHSLWHSSAKRGGYMPTEEERSSLPPARHKLVQRHPASGRNALYIASHASHIIGMPVEEGWALLAALIEFATQPQFVYRHKWHGGDLVIWDNRCTMHRATSFEATDHVRDMRRTTIIETTPEVRVA